MGDLPREQDSDFAQLRNRYPTLQRLFPASLKAEYLFEVRYMTVNLMNELPFPGFAPSLVCRVNWKRESYAPTAVIESVSPLHEIRIS